MAKARKLTPEQMLLVEQLKPHAAGGRLLVETEAPVCEGRRWRIDVSVKERTDQPLKIIVDEREYKYAPLFAIEIDGGAFIAGRHSRGAGIEKDNEKIAAIAREGYRFFRVTPKQVRTGQALAWIKECL